MGVSVSPRADVRPPFWRRPWFLALTGVLCALALLAERCGGDGEAVAVQAEAPTDPAGDEAGASPSTTAPAPAATPDTTAATVLAETDRTGDEPNPGARYPDRPDVQEQDQERVVGGDPARLSGYSAWLDRAELRPSVPGAGAAGYLSVTFRVANRDESSQSFDAVDWQVVAPDGRVLPPLFASSAHLIDGDVAPNGEIGGSVFYEVGALRGRFFVVFDPEPTDTGRGVWEVSL